MKLAVHVDSVTGAVVVGTVAADRAEARRIIEVVAQALGLRPERIRRHDRTQVAALARFLAWWLVRRRTTLTYPQIGRLFDRHHSTVISAIDRYGPGFEPSGQYAELAALVEARLDAAISSKGEPNGETDGHT